MQCPQCKKELPPGAAHCPYCAAVIAAPPQAEPTIGATPPPAQTAEPKRQTFCVKCGAPLPPEAGFCTQCSTPRSNVAVQPPTPPIAQPRSAIPGQVSCPRCGSTNLAEAKIAQWAMITGIVLALFTCGLSLLLLLVKEPNRCHNCNFEFK